MSGRRVGTVLAALAFAATGCQAPLGLVPGQHSDPAGTETGPQIVVKTWDQTGRVLGVDFTVRRPVARAPVAEGYAPVADPGRTWLAVDVTVVNNSDRTQNLLGLSQVRTDRGQAVNYGGFGVSELPISLPPGERGSGIQYLQVDRASKELRLEVATNGLRDRAGRVPFPSPVTLQFRGPVPLASESRESAPAAKVPTERRVEEGRGHCDDPDWWFAQQSGDPGTYVEACGEWPTFVEQPPPPEFTYTETLPPPTVTIEQYTPPESPESTPPTDDSTMDTPVDPGSTGEDTPSYPDENSTGDTGSTGSDTGAPGSGTGSSGG